MSLDWGKLDFFSKLKKMLQSFKNTLQGQCHEIFCFWFFSWISFPPAPEYPIMTVLNFLENSRRYSQVKVCHWYQRHRQQICYRYQRHRRQILPPVSLVLLIPVNCRQYQRHRCQWHRWLIMGTIAGCWDLKVNLKAKMYLKGYSTSQRCPN